MQISIASMRGWKTVLGKRKENNVGFLHLFSKGILPRFGNPFPDKPWFFLQYKSFENTVEKGEIARYEQFFLFPLCFLPVRSSQPFALNLKLSSANSFSLEESKIYHVGKG